MAAFDLLKRLIVIGVVLGLCLLALFIASETRNIIATSDKSILFVMPGVPLVAGLLLLLILNWREYFAVSTVLLVLFAICIVALMVFEAGGAPRNLRSMGQSATIQGALYIGTLASMVLFVGYGALAPLRGEPEAREIEEPPSGRGLPWGWFIGGAVIGAIILALAAYYRTPPEMLNDVAPVETPGADSN